MADESSFVPYYLARSGGRLACRHPVHRMATVRGSSAEVAVPECAGREAWLKARMGGIGGSEIGALIGVSEYETPFSVWQVKNHGGKDLDDVPAIEWGHRLEDVVAQKTAEVIGMESRFAGGLWVDRDREFLRVTPDRFACKRRSWDAVGVIECKTAGDDEYWRSGSITPGSTTDTGSAPLSYQVQVQWQLGIIGLKKGWLGCLVFGAERQFFTVEIDFDPEWYSEMVDEAERFWHANILGGEIPMHDFRHPKTEELIKKQFPTVVRPSVQLPDDADEWLEEYRKAKAEAEKADKRLSAVKNYFRMQVADAGAGYLGDRKVVSYPVVTTRNVDVSLLRERYPEVAEEVTTTSTHRRLTIRPPKVDT